MNSGGAGGRGAGGQLHFIINDIVYMIQSYLQCKRKAVFISSVSDFSMKLNLILYCSRIALVSI